MAWTIEWTTFECTTFDNRHVFFGAMLFPMPHVGPPRYGCLDVALWLCCVTLTAPNTFTRDTHARAMSVARALRYPLALTCATVVPPCCGPQDFFPNALLKSTGSAGCGVFVRRRSAMKVYRSLLLNRDVSMPTHDNDKRHCQLSMLVFTFTQQLRRQEKYI